MVSATPRAWRIAAIAVVSLVVVYMLAPLAVVIATSFSASQFLVFPPRGLSLRWYAEVLSSPAYLQAAWTSAWIAVIVTALAVLVGTPAGIALARHHLRGATWWSALFLSPLVLPVVVLGIGLLAVFSKFLGGPSYFAIVIGHWVICLPYVIRTVGAVAVGIDRYAEEAARLMGARWWERYLYVVLPQCRTGILAGAFLAFNISFDDAVVALFLRAPGIETLPLLIYGRLEFSPDPSVAAVSALLVGLTILFVVALERWFGLGKLAH